MCIVRCRGSVRAPFQRDAVCVPLAELLDDFDGGRRGVDEGLDGVDGLVGLEFGVVGEEGGETRHVGAGHGPPRGGGRGGRGGCHDLLFMFCLVSVCVLKVGGRDGECVCTFAVG